MRDVNLLINGIDAHVTAFTYSHSVLHLYFADPFYPFGAGAGDSMVPTGAPAVTSPALTLAPPFRFFSRNENTIYVRKLWDQCVFISTDFRGIQSVLISR